MSTQVVSECTDSFEFIREEVYSVSTGSPSGQLNIGTVQRFNDPGSEKWVVDAWCGITDTGRYPSREAAATRLLEIHKAWFHGTYRPPITRRGLIEQLRTIGGPDKRVVGLIRGRNVPLLGLGESVADVVALQFDCTELAETDTELPRLKNIENYTGRLVGAAATLASLAASIAIVSEREKEGLRRSAKRVTSIIQEVDHEATGGPTVDELLERIAELEA